MSRILIALTLFTVYLSAHAQENTANNNGVAGINSLANNQEAFTILISKLGQIQAGNVAFDEAEFNVLMLAGLAQDADGQKLLAVSDSIKAYLHEGEIEVNAIISLDKLEKVEPAAREALEQFNQFFLFLDGSKLNITVYGTPVARKGGIAIRDDFHIKVGAIPLSNGALRQLGVDVELANIHEIYIDKLAINSINLKSKTLELGVTPNL